MEQSQLDQLVDSVMSSVKYRDVAEELVRRIGAGELAKRRNLKEAIKATKGKLHQIGGAYFAASADYARWGLELERALASGQPESLRAACRAIMGQHASTRERLDILDAFYPAIFEQLGPVRSVADLACGLNPLAIPWMPLAPGAAYYAYDIYRDMLGFLAGFMARLPLQGRAEARDVAALDAAPEVDLALLLKALPCLEQLDRGVGARLLDAVRARHLVVSFPIQSLGGREKGMAAHYEAGFRALLAPRGWEARRLMFATEMVFVVKTDR